MVRLAVLVTLALVVALLGAGTPSAPAAPRSDTSAARAVQARVVGQAERRLARALTARGPAYARRARRALRLGVDGWVFGSPLLAVVRFTQRLPANTPIGVGRLSTPATRAVVLPNNDTVYTTARVDLSGGPVVLRLPDLGGRAFVVQLMDAYSDVVASVSRRTRGTRAGDVALVGPGWRGSLPAGLRAVRSATNRVWLLARFLVRTPADLPAVNAAQRAVGLTPLAAWRPGAPVPAAVVLDRPPPLEPSLPAGLAFFAELEAALAGDPPRRGDAAVVRRLEALDRDDAATRAGLAGAPAVGGRVLDALRRAQERAALRRTRGWVVLPRSTGRFGRAYLQRALTARIALAANVPEEITYALARRDSRGRPLDGRRAYTVRFAAGELPPVRAFWSLTLYGPDLFLVPNPLDRFALGDRTPGLAPAADGSLTLHIGPRAPAGAGARWLPAPPGPFVLALRLAEPRASVLAGRWPLPRLERRR